MSNAGMKVPIKLFVEGAKELYILSIRTDIGSFSCFMTLGDLQI